MAHHARAPRLYRPAAAGADTEETGIQLLVDIAPPATLADLSRIKLRVSKLTSASVTVRTSVELPVDCSAEILAQVRHI